MAERLAWSICLPLILALSLLAWLAVYVVALLIYMLPYWAFCPHPLVVLWALLIGGWI